MTEERREGMSGGMGCIALYPVLFSIPRVRGSVFSSLTRRARARSLYSRYERRAIRFPHAERERKREREKERKVNYIMQTLRFAITSISNVS